jgi:hypothetical protein
MKISHPEAASIIGHNWRVSWLRGNAIDEFEKPVTLSCPAGRSTASVSSNVGGLYSLAMVSHENRTSPTTPNIPGTTVMTASGK